MGGAGARLWHTPRVRVSPSWLAKASLVIALGALSSSAGAEPHEHGVSSANFDKYVPGASELEGRIIAPCCWTQTIDIHGSEIATALRQEIRARLAKGESAESIESSLVERYGAKIRAVPPGSHLGSIGGAVAFSLGLAGVGAIVLLRRWQRRSAKAARKDEKSEAVAPTKADPSLDARLDAELAELDGD